MVRSHLNLHNGNLFVCSYFNLLKENYCQLLQIFIDQTTSVLSKESKLKFKEFLTGQLFARFSLSRLCRVCRRRAQQVVVWTQLFTPSKGHRWLKPKRFKHIFTVNVFTDLSSAPGEAMEYIINSFNIKIFC